jgi:PPOX class probable F420-dependent enzyme
VELTPAQAQLFKDPNFLTVSTVGIDGGPRATTIWTDLDEDGMIVLDGNEQRKWVGNLRRDPRVALAIHDEKDPYKKLSVVGKAVEFRPEEEGGREWINRLNRKYHPDRGDYPVRPGERRVLIKVEPERVHGFNV